MINNSVFKLMTLSFIVFFFSLFLISLKVEFTGLLIVIFVAIILLVVIVIAGKIAEYKLIFIILILVIVVVGFMQFGPYEFVFDFSTDPDDKIDIKGDYAEEGGAFYIEKGTVVITKNNSYWKNPGASFDVKGSGKVKVIFEPIEQKFGCGCINSGFVEFDTKGKIHRITFSTNEDVIFVQFEANTRRKALYQIENKEPCERTLTLIFEGEDFWINDVRI